MKQKELKQLIKPLVKEIMLEVFTELHLDQIIGESISKSMNKVNFIQEQKEVPQRQIKDPKIEERRLAAQRQMLDEMHVSSAKFAPTPKSKPKNDLDRILEETEQSGYEIYDEGNVNPELVSEDT